MLRVVLAALLVGVVAVPTVRAQNIDGTWKVDHVTTGSFEQTTGIVRIKTEAGKATGALVAGSPRLMTLTLKGVSVDGDMLRIAFQNGTIEMTFSTRVPKEAAKRVLGVMVVDGTAYPASLSMTDETTLDLKSSSRPLPCPPFTQARSLASRGLSLRIQAQQTKDAEKRKALLKQAAEADATAKKETPRLYGEVLEKHADSPAVFEATTALLRSAQSNNTKPDEVKGWAATAMKSAQAYGPRFQAEVASQIATALLIQDDSTAQALDFARQAERLMPAKVSASEEIRVLHLLTRALRKSDLDAEAKKFDVRIAKLDEVLDTEYLKKMPPFKAAPFAGRKSKSDRVVMMELFTGAACPPCVAADLAFDVLQKSYTPRDLVLVQYHMHIPGPDPMTNPDTEARWKYYAQSFPKEIRGVPSSVFNGQPKASGGGGIANAESKYQAYCAVIDPLLENPAAIKLSAKATRKGDAIDISVDVAGLSNPSPDKKLRILLAEETVRYAGSNKIRMHHNVVRDFPGGVAGKALTDESSKHAASVNLGGLRGDLTKYLDAFQATGKTFSNPARPMAMEHLRVIAFVQDDATREILQAVQVEVK